MPWSQLNFVCLPTYASKKYEMRIDLEKLGLAAGDSVRLNFNGSDELEKSVPIALNTAPARQGKPSLARDHNGQVRIANLNTLHQGLADPRRSESIGRLLRAAQADIYCFQEEFEEVTFRQAAPKIVPTSSGQHVNLHWSGDCGIATSLPLEPIPMELARGVAALIELPDHKHVAVISVHFKCCGYTGSWQDEARVYQAQQLADNIRGLRKGEFGDKCKKAGIVVIGDYNLVGSRKPLDILKRAGQVRFQQRSPNRESSVTRLAPADGL